MFARVDGPLQVLVVCIIGDPWFVVYARLRSLRASLSLKVSDMCLIAKNT
jgi:hypothetical protein